MAPVALYLAAPEEALADAGSREALNRLLSDRERERWGGLVREEDRHTFLLAHALVRLALSSRGAPAPEDWSFEDAPGGKPRITGPAGAPTPIFSLSHTRGLAVCAVRDSGAVGVDAEPRNRAEEVLELADTAFTREEIQTLHRAAPDVRGEHALWLWTAKEAVLKGAGTGLRESLQSVEAAGYPAASRRAISAGQSVWTLWPVPVGESHLVTIAVSGEHDEPEPDRFRLNHDGSLRPV